MAGPAVTNSTIVGYQVGLCTGDAITGYTGSGTAPTPTTGQLWPRGNP